MDAEPSRLQTIRSSNLLSGLTDVQIEEISANSRMATVEKGEVVWLNGNEVSFFGIVGAGFVKMTRTTSGGQEITTEIMGPGQVFGLLGTIDGTGCPQTAKAVCKTHFLKVAKSAVLPIYHENVVLKERLVKSTTARLRQSYSMIVHLTSGKVDQRVAAVLLMLANSYGEEQGEAVSLTVPLTRQDIAEFAGTTVESTIRVMSKWQKDGLVSTEAKHILLKDPQKLLHTANGA